MLKQATSLATASLVAVFMTGCASLPNVYQGGKKDNVCKPGDTYQECCEKRELKKPLKYRFGGACERNGGDNDHSAPSRDTDTPDTDTPDTDTPDTDTPDTEGPSDQDRGNTGHDHSNDGDKGDDRDGGPGQSDKGDKGGQDNEGASDQGHNDGGKNDSRDGGPGMGDGGRGDVGGRHSALKVVRPAFA